MAISSPTRALSRRNSRRKPMTSALFYIATVETAKHRFFQFLDAEIVPDNMLVVIASSDAFHLGVLSSHIHKTWALRAGGWLGVGNDPRYSKSRCFDPFPFPESDAGSRTEIAAIAQKIDRHRKGVQAAHPDISLTKIYNILEKLRADAYPLTSPEEDIKEHGLVLILSELHDELDAAVFRAYGWPQAASEDEILGRLVTLNRQRALEERQGQIRWLRPDYRDLTFWHAQREGEAAGSRPRRNSHGKAQGGVSEGSRRADRRSDGCNRPCRWSAHCQPGSANVPPGGESRNFRRCYPCLACPNRLHILD